jgi:hypothetical protein
MNLRILTYNTLPSKKDKFWQIVIIPTIAVLNNGINECVAVNFEWLFFSLTILFLKNDKAGQFTT